MAASLYNMGSFGKNAEEEVLDEKNVYRMPFFILKTPDDKQVIDMLYEDPSTKRNLFIGTNSKFQLLADIDLFLDDKKG